jgi:pectin methylesterase-like acyl-CoA thioesterase
MRRIFFILLLGVITSYAKLAAQVFDIVVAQDGSGDVTTLTRAINKITDSKTTRTLIYVKNGTYNEKVNFSSAKTNVSLVGESADGVIITYDDYNGKTSSISTASSYTLAANGTDFYAENLTIKNTAGNVGQAVALLTTGDRQVFNNCMIYGFQDTYYAQKGRQYLLNSYIEGATDFIFGNAATVLQQCTINCVSGGQYISAPGDAQLISYTSSGDTIFHGLLYDECTVTASSGVSSSSYYLGRTWAVPGSAIYKNCVLGTHINTVGWYDWNGTKGRYGEYKSKDTDGNLVDVTGRVSWSRQFTDDVVTNYYNLDSFLCKSNVVWNPVPMTVALAAPAGLSFSDSTLTWTAVTDAIGYVIIRNDSTIGFSASNTYKDTTVVASKTYTYAVKSVTSSGTLSAASTAISVSVSVTDVEEITKSAFEMYVSNKHLVISEPVDVEIYSLPGILMITKENTQDVSLENLTSGAYLVKAIDEKGKAVIKKISFR